MQEVRAPLRYAMKDLENRREITNRELLAELVKQALPEDRSLEAAPGLFIGRVSHPVTGAHGLLTPSLCVIAQGAKQLVIGDASYRYDPEHYVISTVEVPFTGHVIEASPGRPYLMVRLELDPSLVGAVMVEADLQPPDRPHGAKAVYVSRFEGDLLDAVVRLVRMIDTPTEPMWTHIKREIIYRLLTGEQGDRLRHFPMLGAHVNRIAQAVDRLRREYDKPLSIQGLAKDLGMSTSAFHLHFKTVMDMSPLQFQKLLRLQEARKLMLTENMDAASASYRVGYEDASHFSRDYKKHFGDAPIRDVGKLREMVAAD